MIPKRMLKVNLYLKYIKIVNSESICYIHLADTIAIQIDNRNSDQNLKMQSISHQEQKTGSRLIKITLKYALKLG